LRLTCNLTFERITAAHKRAMAATRAPAGFAEELGDLYK
jgi:hypothetical protein